MVVIAALFTASVIVVVVAVDDGVSHGHCRRHCGLRFFLRFRPERLMARSDSWWDKVKKPQISAQLSL